MNEKGKKGKWKPVHLTGNLISKGVDGLVGIEELTDYKIVKGNVVRSFHKESGRKRNAVQTDTDFLLPNAKRRKKLRQSSSKGRELNHKRKHHEEIKIERSTQALKTDTDEGEELNVDKDEAESVYSDNERESDFSDKMSAWSGLGIASPILRALAEQGFVEPTEIQAKTLPATVLGQRDVLGAAETGSGKTLAFGIPILHKILQDKEWSTGRTKKDDIESCQNDTDPQEWDDSELIDIGCESVATDCPKSKLYALVLTPTRELAMQVHKHLTSAARYTGIKIAVVVGGMATQKQERLLNRRPEIVVATPGRLWELIQDGNPHLAQVNRIRYLAIDETDRMLEKGHFQELHKLLELLNVAGNKKRPRQNFVFSATLTLVHEPPGRLKTHNKKLRLTPGQKLQNIMTMLNITNPKVVDVTKETGTADTLTEARIICAFEEKDFYIYYFIQLHKGRTLIFCNSISCVRRLAQLLTLLKCRPLPFHANMMQRQRLKNLDRFREDPHGLLLATDVAARGLDIPDVQHVVHYQVPRTSESYIHRSGRTARAKKEGLTLLLIEPAEVPHYTRLCRTLGRTKDLPLFPVSINVLDAVKQRVSLARELDQIQLATRRSNSETGWFRKALTEMDMLVDDSDLPKQLDHDESSKLRRLAVIKRKELQALLSKRSSLCNVSNAVNVVKSAVDMRARPQNGSSLFLKRNTKKHNE